MYLLELSMWYSKLDASFLTSLTTVYSLLNLQQQTNIVLGFYSLNESLQCPYSIASNTLLMF